MKPLITLIIIGCFLISACDVTMQLPKPLPEKKTTSEPDAQKELADARTPDTPHDQEIVNKKAEPATERKDCTCTYKTVEIDASYGERETFSPGRGSYTGAGGLRWTLQPSPTYCPGESIIPIKIQEISNSKLLNEYTIELGAGETSNRITHPKIKSVDFTLTVLNVEEACG